MNTDMILNANKKTVGSLLTVALVIGICMSGAAIWLGRDYIETKARQQALKSRYDVQCALYAAECTKAPDKCDKEKMPIFESKSGEDFIVVPCNNFLRCKAKNGRTNYTDCTSTRVQQ